MTLLEDALHRNGVDCAPLTHNDVTPSSTGNLPKVHSYLNSHFHQSLYFHRITGQGRIDWWGFDA
jgi:hypothetical protein